MQFVFEEALIHQIKKAAEENPDQMNERHLDMIRDYRDTSEILTQETESSYDVGAGESKQG